MKFYALESYISKLRADETTSWELKELGGIHPPSEINF